MLGGINLYQYEPNGLIWIDPLGLNRCTLAGNTIKRADGSSLIIITNYAKIRKLTPLDGYTENDGYEYKWKNANGSTKVVRNPGSNYDGAMVGEGLVRFSCSELPGYDTESLRNGRLTASYDLLNEPETDKFVKAVWKIFKKGAKKVYLINRETGQIADKPETRFFCLARRSKEI